MTKSQGRPYTWREAARAVATSGLLRPIGPRALADIARAHRRFGRSAGLVIAASAARFPDRIAIIDDQGPLSYRRLLHWGEAIAAGLHQAAPGSKSVAILCRNHRGFAAAMVAGTRLGADVLFVNTELATTQLAAILQRHLPDIVIHDEEYSAALDEIGFAGLRVQARVTGSAPEALSLDSLAERPAGPAPRVRGHVKMTLLTSGTSGLAKGVARPLHMTAIAQMAATGLIVVGLRPADVVLIGPPFFHGFGLFMLVGTLAVGGTVVTRPRFDPLTALEDLDRHGASMLAGVPVMLQRLLAVSAQDRARFDLHNLRRAVTGAAPITSTTVQAFTDAFGPILVNGYGSTEAGIVAFATASDLVEQPGTCGRPGIGVSVRVLRSDRTAAAVGETGTIFTRGGLEFGGYTPDRSGSPSPAKEFVDGHVNTGDMGHLDAAGRLYIDGRDDEMIVSGGENVYPAEVADVLATHPAVTDVAVIGVPDHEFGQVLRAYLVTAGQMPSTDELKAHIRGRLEKYKVPKEFVAVDEIPRNPTGKILRHQLDQATQAK